MGVTREDFSKIIKAINAVYKDTVADKSSFDVWYALLKDIDYKSLECGTLRYLQTNHFPPTPSDIRNMAIVPAIEMTDGEAWAKARRAIADSTYHADEQFAKLPPRIQAVFESPAVLREWGASENSSEDVMRSNFLKLYANAKEMEKENNLYSADVKLMIQQTANKLLEG